MSKIIKNAQLEFKDDSGNYVGVNSIAERKETELQAAITAHGNNVRSTIPPDYTDLVDSVAHTFDLTKNYSAGDYVYYTTGTSPNQVTHLYRFNAAYTANSGWGNADTTEVAVCDEVTQINANISNLQGAINYQLIEDTILGWEMGSYNGATGAKFSASTCIRNDTFFGAITGVVRITVKTGYQALIFAWNLSNNTYAGCLKTSGAIDTTTANMAFVEEFNCSKYSQYKFRVVVVKDFQSLEITPSEGVNCVFYYPSDKTLSLENKAADAKSVGEVKHDVFHAIDTGTYTLINKNEWVHGVIQDDGTIKYAVDHQYRVCSNNLITADKGMKLYALNGYVFEIVKYSSGTWTKSGWVYSYVLSAGEQFKIQIKAVPEDTSIVADFDTFVDNIRYNCFLYEEIKEIEKYARIESVEPHSKQFDLLGLFLKNGAFKTGRMLFPDNTAKIKFHFPNSEFSAQFELFEKDGDYGNSTLSSVYHDGDTMQLDGQYLTYILTITPDVSMTLSEFKNLVGFSVRITYESFDGSVVARNADCERYVKALMLTNNGTYYNYFNPVLVHVSDIHGDSQRLKNAYEYAKSLNAGLLINTGDTVFNTPTDGIGFAVDYDDEFGIPTAIVVGNHDSLFRTEETRVYSEIIDSFATKWDYVANSKPYYYWDVDSINIRCIALNQFMNGAQSYSQDQIDMLCNALASTPENYGVLLLNHMPECYLGDLIDKQAPFDAANGSWSMGDYKDIVPDIIDTFISKGSLSKSYANTGISVSVNFTSINSGVEFIAHINGHTHRDCVGYYNTTNKQLVLNVTCTNSGYGKPGTNELNDNSDLPRGDKGKVQDAFNVYSIDRVNGVIKVARIGSNLTTDFVKMDYVVANYRN